MKRQACHHISRQGGDNVDGGPSGGIRGKAKGRVGWAGAADLVQGVKAAALSVGVELPATICNDRPPPERKSSSQSCLKSNAADRHFWRFREPMGTVIAPYCTRL